ncbi:MAG TPA: iron transporter FeoB, partial [Gammaproteobacteria bacterium]|nr:iron transporter FeoB [Gammaproteobacteria bacterium]
GVPVIPTVAKDQSGFKELLTTVNGIVKGNIKTQPHHVKRTGELQQSLNKIISMVQEVCPGLPNTDWVALRILEGDQHIREALIGGKLSVLTKI